MSGIQTGSVVEDIPYDATTWDGNQKAPSKNSIRDLIEGLSTVIASTWNVLGNTGLSAVTNFLGSTDAVDVVFKSNSIEHMRLTTGGDLKMTSGSTVKNTIDDDFIIDTDYTHVHYNLLLGSGSITINSGGELVAL